MRAIDPTGGQILFRTKAGDVVDIARLPEREMRALRREMQMISQDPYGTLNPCMNLLDIVGEPLLVIERMNSPLSGSRACCDWSGCARSTCGAFRTRSAAASASGS